MTDTTGLVTVSAEIAYHPDPTINAEITGQAIDAERIDLAVGYAPRSWTCPCGTTHSRGHFLTIGTHRCLSCGYVGTKGVMHGAHHVLSSAQDARPVTGMDERLCGSARNVSGGAP